MPECEGCHKDVKRITKYSKTGQWLCETCVADLANLLAPPTEAKEPAVIAHAAVSDLHFEEGDEIEEGDSSRYDEGDTVTSEAVLAKIQTNR